MMKRIITSDQHLVELLNEGVILEAGTEDVIDGMIQQEWIDRQNDITYVTEREDPRLEE